MEAFIKMRKGWLVIAFLILAVICALIAVRVVKSMDYHHTDNDFFTFWLAGHLVTQGQSPYDPALWIAGYHQYDMEIIPNLAFLYPLPLTFLFAPLGWLSFHTAYVTWVTLIQLMIVLSLMLLLKNASSSRSKFFFISLMAGIVLFRPTTLTLTQGQVSALFLLILTGMALFWSQGKWFWGGILLGLTMLKPSLGVIVIALLAAWLLLHRRRTALAGVATSCLFLLLGGLAYRPNWIVEYWSIGSNKLAQTFGGSPTVWGLGALVCHSNSTCMLTFGGTATLLLVLGFLWLIARHKGLAPGAVLALGITVTLLVTPYTWTYDQLLLIIPITLVTLAIDRLGANLLFAVAVFLAIDVLVVILLFFDFALQVEILNVFVPLVVFGLAAWFLTRPLP